MNNVRIAHGGTHTHTDLFRGQDQIDHPEVLLEPVADKDTPAVSEVPEVWARCGGVGEY